MKIIKRKGTQKSQKKSNVFSKSKGITRKETTSNSPEPQISLPPFTKVVETNVKKVVVRRKRKDVGNSSRAKK